jgi:hypothetical protein
MWIKNLDLPSIFFIKKTSYFKGGLPGSTSFIQKKSQFLCFLVKVETSYIKYLILLAIYMCFKLILYTLRFDNFKI